MSKSKSKIGAIMGRFRVKPRRLGNSNFLKKIIAFIFSSNGIIITLFIGILINFISNQISDITSRQRYLELLQMEIRYHVVRSNAIGDEYERSGTLYNEAFASDDIYKAGLESGYLLEIDPDILSQIVVYYTAVPIVNSWLSEFHGIIKESKTKWFECMNANHIEYPEGLSTAVCSRERSDYEWVLRTYSVEIASSWNYLVQSSPNFINEFNPTEDRIGSPILRMIMGGEALGLLK